MKMDETVRGGITVSSIGLILDAEGRKVASEALTKIPVEKLKSLLVITEKRNGAEARRLETALAAIEKAKESKSVPKPKPVVKPKTESKVPPGN